MGIAIVGRIAAATLLTFGFASAAPAAAQYPPVSEYSDPAYQALSGEQLITACDQYASHPLDPLKPDGVDGVARDSDIDALSAYLYCARAFQADQNNPRIMFQWGRANQVLNTRLVSQPRQMYRLAYRGGSEIAGVYLARLPPEKTFAELEADVQASIARMRGQQRSRPMTGAERDAMLIGSIVTIGSVALLRILSGESSWGDSECSGGHMIDVNTHEVLCNGLVVGSY